MTAPTPFERVIAYFTGDEYDLAVMALRSYYGINHHYTGSAFDSLLDPTTPDTYTAKDMLAVSMLSVTVPARAALCLLEGEADEALAVVAHRTSLWTHPEMLDRDGSAWALWRLVESHHNVGSTIASKLLAVKRPDLLPIYDQHVAEALHFGESYWSFWQDVARSPSVKGLTDAVRLAMVEAGAPDSVTTLRAIDVVVWMRQHGWKMHDSRCALGCDFRAFGPTS